jgi:two-component system sensor histidine kinase BarA
VGNEWGIKSRVLFLTLVPTIIISLLLSAYFTSTRLQDLETALRDRGYAIALQLAPASEYGVFSGNSHTLQRLANETLAESEVRSVSIFNKDGQLLAHAGHEHKTPTIILSVVEQPNGITMADTGSTLLFTVPVTIRDMIIEDYPYASSMHEQTHRQDNVIGWISIELGRMTTTLRQYQVLFACSLIVLLGLGISGFFAYRIGRDVTRPILQIAYAVEKIKNGNLDTRVYTNARGELRLLEAGVNTMAASLKTAHEEMQQSVEQATADLRQTLETIEIQNIELEMARKEAEAASRVKSEFLANMSHEIRTPLNGVIGFINLLMKTTLNTRQIDYLSTIQKSANNLLSIINDILDFSKIEAGKLNLAHIPMDLRECVEDAITLMAPSSHEKALELVPMIYTDVPERIMGDHLRLKQIITNLVNNSIKFTEQGSIIVRVMLEKETHEHVVLCVSVTDSGIGLTVDEQKNLFQAFKQADSTNTRKFGGTGLGLVISKRLVQQMNGEIGVESEANKGSTFWFTFVADKVNAQDITPPPYQDLAGFKILILEPHPTTRLSLTHLLTTWGVEVQHTDTDNTLQELLLEAKKNNAPYHCVLIGANQIDLAQFHIETLIQSITYGHACHVGILANTTDQITYDRVLEAGALLCLPKPVQRKKLYDALYEVLIQSNVSQNLLPKMPVVNPPLIALPKPAKIKNIHILSVDDYPANLLLVEALLEDLNISVTSANNGFEALNLCAQQHFDLILMDIQMPDMDGIEVTNHIRTKEAPGQHTPIIAITAHALLSEKEALLAAGMDDYLSKPINDNELITLIYQWVKKIPQPANITHCESMGTIISQVCTQPIDWPRCVKLAGNKPHIAKEILQEFINVLPADQQNINRAFSDYDLSLMREHIHRLHGACCYCGVPTLKMAAKKAETAVAQANHKQIQFLIVELNKEINKILQFNKQNPNFIHEQIIKSIDQSQLALV